jgi:protein-disulfide isomerase
MTADKMWTRREAMEVFAAGGLAVAGGVSLLTVTTPAFAQAAGSVPVADLMADNALPDVWEGKADAPVTIVEYASMTCPHCAHFHAETFPAMKTKYIDTGKVRFTLREFPFDPLATAGFMVARCLGDKRDAMVDLLFSQQKNWAYSDKPLQGLAALVKQAGMSQESFEACLKDQKLYENVNAVRDRGSKTMGVDATPTFFINGKKFSGDMTLAELDKQLEPLLKS